jgi:YD repeat-containing protein
LESLLAVQMTDAQGKTRRTGSDALGRLRKVWEDPSVFGYTTTYGYDSLNNLTAVVQGSQTRSFVYDSLKQLRKATQPEYGLKTEANGSIEYTYYPDGSLETRKDPAQVVTTMTYDSIGRIVTKSYSSEPAKTISHCYDGKTFDMATGACTATLTYANSRGQLTGVRKGAVNESRGYDAAGRVVTSSYGARVFEYEYYRNDSLASTKYPGGQKTVRNCYDTLGRIKWVSGSLGAMDCSETTNPANSSNSYVSGLQHTPHGGIKSMRYGNGRYEESCFDADRLMLKIKRLGTALSANSDCAQNETADLWRMELGYLDNIIGNNGNVTSQKIGAPLAGGGWWEALQSYSYDGVNRLTGVSERRPVNASTPNWSTGFSYDAFGNMVMSGGAAKAMAATAAVQYDSARNRVVKTQANVDIDYDKNGNMTNHPEVGATSYDAENMVTSIVKSGVTETYEYDGSGRRSKRCRAAECIEYVYDGMGQLMLEVGRIGGGASEWGELPDG